MLFVKQLMRQIRGPILILWDNINTHESRRLECYRRLHPRLHLENLPPYPPELNPRCVEIKRMARAIGTPESIRLHWKSLKLASTSLKQSRC